MFDPNWYSIPAKHGRSGVTGVDFDLFPTSSNLSPVGTMAKAQCIRLLGDEDVMRLLRQTKQRYVAACFSSIFQIFCSEMMDSTTPQPPLRLSSAVPSILHHPQGAHRARDRLAGEACVAVRWGWWKRYDWWAMVVV